MNPAGTHYQNESITFATMHGKELLARQSFADVLGASVIAPPELDTDVFGTFTGEVPRAAGPRGTALAKARRGMELGNTRLGLASEGTFSTGFGTIVENTEVLVFVDDILQLELVEGSIELSPLPAARPIAHLDDALNFATAVGFPEQWIIVQTTHNGTTTSYKNIGDPESLRMIGEKVFTNEYESVTISPDYRAHHCPSRAVSIRALCERMARRLATECPSCSTPGFGHVDVEYGVPCESCGIATNMIAADIHECGKCAYRQRVMRSVKRASPQWCNDCNP
ncbi:hypothetical protein ADILRU_0042 [Leifsonia rubra CMS 76R]|nr:hypothetical protein ADILRU_0042 [Leifsonia rubra CMS 76R]